MIDARMLRFLACPKCAERPPLELHGASLVCTACRWRYPIVDGLPRLMIDEAAPPEPGSPLEQRDP
jgi:uncharacterized protein YbaR (Trm112 family)